MNKIASWGNYKKVKTNLIYPKDKKSLIKLIKQKKELLTFGNGRSYGDVCLNKKNLISLRNFKRIISFDKKKGIIDVESGILMSELLPIILKNNFFLPVTSGTKFVTLGGMVANNIHGKNVVKNYFSDYIISIKLINNSGKLINCSKKNNKKLFDLTTGGIGLTGTILSVKFKLKKIYSTKLIKKNIYFRNLNNLYDFDKLKSKYDYSVTWIDSFSSPESIRGIHFFAKHILKKKEDINFKIKKNYINFLHKFVFKIFNNFYLFRFVNIVFFLSHYLNPIKKVQFEKFFYIQDKYYDWNKIYGDEGFVEVHILIPKKKAISFLKSFFEFCKRNKIYSNLIVLKRLKHKKKFINFAGDGLAFSADFTINKNYSDIKSFFLNNAHKYNYIFYTAKDSIFSKKNFKFDKNFIKFKKEIKKINKNNKISSLLSDRTGITS